MISFGNIRTIAKYESKVLWRNWFFRIFSAGILFFLFIFDMAIFSPIGESRWFPMASSWGIPYTNMIMLAIPQAAAVIFLASGLVKKNKKIDTNEVFFARAISNADYVLGKALALFKLFLLLNVVILTMGLIYNLTNPILQFNPLAYVVYPLLMSLPTIVFITGLSFLLVTLLKNQPVSIILLLGFSGVILIYFFGKYDSLLDYMAFRLNLMASDITGFSNINYIIFHRTFYFLTGVAFLFGSASTLERLSNHRRNQLTTGLLTLILTGTAAYIMYSIRATQISSLNLRADMVELNGRWAETPNINIVSNDLTIEHKGEQISGVSEMVVINDTDQSLDTIFFTLNPGLQVTNLTMDDGNVDFTRELHIISILPAKPIEADGNARINISYEGEIIEETAHLEVEQDRYEEIDGDFLYAIEKRYAFLQPDYALFTKDILWYPDNRAGYSRLSPVKERRSFVNFNLKVKTSDPQIPLSQGSSEKIGEYHQFSTEFPLPQLSLVIGTYERKTLTVDSVSYELYYYPENDYFSVHFDQLEDTLSILVRDLVNSYEHDQQLKYPFRRLQFVEVPIQFSAYNKIYEDQQAFVQPEMVLWPEKGGSLRDFDFGRQFQSMDRQARRENQVLDDRQKQANVFNNLIKKVFTRQLTDGWFFDGRNVDEPNYSIFPNLYSYNSGIVSKEWALLNKSVSEYLNSGEQPETDFSRNVNGISFTEECNELMRDAPLMEILTQETDFAKIQKSVTLKGEYLFSYLEQLIGEKELKEFLYAWINENQHQLTSYEDFRNGILNRFELDIDPIIQQVYSDTDQPSFEIQDLEQYELLDGDRKRYQVKFLATNTGTNDGVIKVKFNDENSSRDDGFFRQRDEEVATDQPEYAALIRSGETRLFGFILDTEPREISINTLVSKNIPSVINITPGQFNLREKAIPFEGERVIKNLPESNQNEIIVDNEDQGFSSFSPIKDTYLRAWLDERNPSTKKYYGIWRRSYSKWRLTTGSDFYGQHIRSAHFTRSGKGEKITEWTPELKETGFYDLYVYMMGKNQNQYTGRGGSERSYTYQYIINHADGKDEISFNLSNAEPGWNYLGSYYFTDEDGSVVLTDECDLRTVYADAVKWVRQ
ncbi:MAG: hypothetical protein RIM99_18895 [Cyclobacteriaceae bacterium]